LGMEVQERVAVQLAVGLFGRKRPQALPEGNSEPIVANRLQELTGSDAEMYQSLSKILFLAPKRINASLEDAVSQASAFEASGDKMRAELWYRIAGGIALYRADAGAVRKYFEKAASLAVYGKPEYKAIMTRAEDAVGVARKFYETM